MSFVCNLCPRSCGALRDGAQGSGFCRMGELPRLARAALHFDEEPVISGDTGSGAVFFSGCSLQCVFCQNYELSHHGYGADVSVERLREIYFELIAQGAGNINLVNPTHYVRAILSSLEGGLPVPVVYNTGGYEKVETLRTLEGRVQIYLPDLKYMDAQASALYSGAANYFEYASQAILEMYRQVGAPEIGNDGRMTRGLLIRHLILPGRAEESKRILRWIHENVPGAWVSLMAQYLPFGESAKYPPLDRRLTQDEYDGVVDYMIDLGMEEGFVQELSSSDETYIPVFDLTGVRDGGPRFS